MGRRPSAVTVPGDRTRLRQVATNLVDNAIRHTPPRTRVTIRVGTRHPPQATRPTAVVGDPPAGPVGILEVADTGPGMPMSAPHNSRMPPRSSAGCCPPGRSTARRRGRGGHRARPTVRRGRVATQLEPAQPRATPANGSLAATAALPIPHVRGLAELPGQRHPSASTCNIADAEA